ncbi:hypothetical protein MMC30_007960 [Trapelia coarctata]|nr:hypothetical protein [Trapelia coarctata]
MVNASSPTSTPASSFTQCSTPEISSIVQIFRDRQNGCSIPTESSLSYQLNRKEYHELQGILEQEGLLDKLRTNYNTSTQVFELQMPFEIHDCPLAKFSESLLGQLVLLGQNKDPVGEVARSINEVRSSSICFPDGSHFDPDTSFCRNDAQYSSVVIEIAYSQTKECLAKKAEEYIRKSEGCIAVVIGFKIEYKGKAASLSVWRPQWVDKDGEDCLEVVQTTVDQEFCNENGQPVLNPNADLHLQLKDFASVDDIDAIGGLDIPILVSSTSLYQYLDHARKQALVKEEGKGVDSFLKGMKEKARRAKEKGGIKKGAEDADSIE